MNFESSALLLTWVAIALLGFALAGVVRQLHALQSGTRLGGALGPPTGMLFSELTEDSSNSPELLIFLEPECVACRDLIQPLRSLARGTQGLMQISAVFRQDPEGFEIPGVKLRGNHDSLFSGMRVPMTPFAVLVGADGRVKATGMIGSEGALMEFVRSVTERSVAA